MARRMVDTDSNSPGLLPEDQDSRGRCFGIFGPIATASESRANGREFGRCWKEWERRGAPAGPFTFQAESSEKNRDNPDWQAYCAGTQENRREWLAGFAEGLKEAAR